VNSFADYELVDQLQPGNHGTFYLARPPARLNHGDELVALKILDRHATDNEFKRMAAELQLLLELQHPHLVDVIDAGHEDGRLYYATRYYRDGSLPLGPGNDLAAIATQVADAADAAHALHEVGVAHRDIKPSNILIADGRGHLSDLGVANYADANFTTTGSSPVGTLAYADPLLIHGEPAGRASDVWSLGASLHAAVVGYSVLGEIPNAHLAGAIEYVLSAVATVSPSCPPPLSTIVAKATHAERPERYLTGEEMAIELRTAARQLAAAAPRAGVPTPVAAPAQAAPPPPAGFDQATPPPLELEGDASTDPQPYYQRPVLVVGQRSVNGHFNHPDATVCWVSGETRGSLGPWVAGRAERPALGVLLFDDGRSYVVRWDTVLGRQPDTDSRVSSGLVAPLALEAELTMSRAHLHLELREWDVFATDISSNGTSIKPAATGQATKMTPGQATLLRDGDTLVIENLSVSYQSHHQAR
jgi:serine/threonine protein kinase